MVRFIEPLLWPRPTTAYSIDLLSYNTSPYTLTHLKDILEQIKRVFRLITVAHEAHAGNILLERFGVP